MSARRVVTGYAHVNGVQLYWQSYGEGGVPLILVHGGYGLTTMFSELLTGLSEDRHVIAIELQGHGHTADIDRRFSFEAFGDDIAGVIRHLGFGEADLLGCSLGGMASLQCASRHPDVIRRLILISIPFRRSAWYPEVLAAFDQMGRAGFEQMRHSPAYAEWAKVAPDPDSFPELMDKTGELLRQPFDWTEQIRQLTMPVQLIYGDADSMPVAHAAEFYALLGGGISEPGWDGSFVPHHRLAVLPGQTHYTVFAAPLLTPVVADFLA
jgi:pimeloyl-ACP methyl ester carboxylesterase